MRGVEWEKNGEWASYGQSRDEKYRRAKEDTVGTRFCAHYRKQTRRAFSFLTLWHVKVQISELVLCFFKTILQYIQTPLCACTVVQSHSWLPFLKSTFEGIPQAWLAKLGMSHWMSCRTGNLTDDQKRKSRSGNEEKDCRQKEGRKRSKVEFHCNLTSSRF